MARRREIPDTEYFTYFNNNPHNRITTDCVIRAISGTLNISYNDLVMDMAKIQCETGLDPSSKKSYTKYLESKGWVKMKEPRDCFNKKIRIKDFIENNPDITCIVTAGSHHLSSIVNGKVRDIWNCSYETMHTYFIKEDL